MPHKANVTHGSGPCVDCGVQIPAGQHHAIYEQYEDKHGVATVSTKFKCSKCCNFCNINRLPKEAEKR